MPTNTKESGLESLIVKHLVDVNGYEQGSNADYRKEYAVDEVRLFRFLAATQADELAQLGLENPVKRGQFLNRLQGEIAKRGVVDVLRRGISAYPVNLNLFYMTPSQHNPRAKEFFGQNIFSVTRQLQFSRDTTESLDLCIFLNGLPIITCELKNQLTRQDVDDAVWQYKNNRNPRELLFQFKRCLVHFAVDDAQIKFCTKLDGKNSWFLPFNKGYQNGAGNPPNPHGLMTDYLWHEIFAKEELANIIENYAQVLKSKDPDSKAEKASQIFPRYHQLYAVKALLADVYTQGVGQKYLIQHSAGSGKSNSIAWLAHQLVGLEKDGNLCVDSIIVVTDRVNLDKQIRDTIKNFTQVKSTVVWAEHSQDLREALSSGKKIIITTVHKFQYILETIGTEHKGRNFAIIIDEAHSSQSGSLSARMNMALAAENMEGEDAEDIINKIIEGRKMLKNASYFAFTATPKNKTLEMFGVAYKEGDFVKRRPFHVYTMKQAIQEGFILDVLQNYTPYESFYKLAKTISDDPLFDKKKAQKKLRAFVEKQPDTITKKARIMVEHFHEQVIRKIGGKARAMVVTAGIERAIDYYYAIEKSLAARKSPYKAIVAFSGEKEYGGKMLTEATINGFASNLIERKFKEEVYRFLVVADKFQTGYDEPLLHTMYVDKPLSDIKAVQTLSRLNRAHPQKFDTFILDFANEPEDIQESFSRYYKTTLLADETDPNKLYDLINELEAHHVYDSGDVQNFIDRYFAGAERFTLDPILDVCVNIYQELDEEAQVSFKSAAKAFVRTYGFLGAILPFGNVAWEKLNIFLTFLTPKLPSPKEEDLSAGVIEAIDLDSYRVQAQTMVAIQLADEDAEIDPVPTSSNSNKPEPELDLLTNILNTFNDLFGNIPWEDEDNVRRQLRELPNMVSKDEGYQNAILNSDRQNARIEFERAFRSAISGIMKDSIELYRQINDNPSLKNYLSESVFNITFEKRL